MASHTVSSVRARAQITLSRVSVSLGGRRILRDLDLAVSESSRIAVVGENGSGKSTLLHVLAGRIPPDSGEVRRAGTWGLAEQEMSIAEDRTVGELVADALEDSRAALQELDDASAGLSEHAPGAEDRFAVALERAESLDAWDAERRVRVALEALDAEPDWARQLADMSVGQRYRVRLACLLGGDDRILLLDEPTNHLDRAGLDFLTERIRSRNGGVVVVSHDRALLADVAETVVDLDPTFDGRPRITGGGYQGYVEAHRAERERWEQAYTREQAERSRLEESLDAAQGRLVSGWRPDKGTGKHQRATRAGGLVQSVHRRREALEAHAVTMPEPPQRFSFPELRSRRGAELVEAEAVAVQDRLPAPVSVAVRGGSRLLVTGPNGAGKSTLLELLAGGLEPDRGRVISAAGVRIGFLRQESELPLERRAGELFATRMDELEASGALGPGQAFDLSSLGLLRAREADRRIGELSTGQLRRLDLALVLASRPHLLLLDEPTNHLSIALVDELTEALRATPAAIVLATHDRQMLRDFEEWPRLELEGARVG